MLCSLVGCMHGCFVEWLVQSNIARVIVCSILVGLTKVVAWLVGCLLVWLVDWLVGVLLGWLVGWLTWLVGRLIA